MLYDSINEDRLFKRFLCCSFIIHVVFFVIKLSFSSYNYTWQENMIEVDLISLNGLDFSDLDEEEFTVSEKLLPQLPKHYRIKQDMKELVGDVGGDALIENEKRITKNRDKLKLIELTKKEALSRLIKEKARKNKKFSSKPSIKLSDSLKKRRKQLLSMASSVQLEGKKTNDSYAFLLKSWIKKHYSVPDLLDYASVKRKAKVKVQIDNRGAILMIALVQSSNNKYFDQLALKTIKDSEPFPSPPKSWVRKEILFPFSLSH